MENKFYMRQLARRTKRGSRGKEGDKIVHGLPRRSGGMGKLPKKGRESCFLVSGSICPPKKKKKMKRAAAIYQKAEQDGSRPWREIRRGASLKETDGSKRGWPVEGNKKNQGSLRRHAPRFSKVR